MLRFLKLCCEREPVVTASIAIGSIGFLMPLLSPGRYREGTYLERLELYRAKHSH